MLPAVATSPRRPRRIADITLPRDLDGRTVQAAKYKALIRELARELGDDLSEVDRRLIGQAAALSIQIERLQDDVIEGQRVDPDAIIRLSSEQRRLLGVLHSKATAKGKADGGAALREYLAEKYGSESDEAEGS